MKRILTLALLSGCAHQRNVARAGELAACDGRLEQLDYQRRDEGPQAEPAPELVWYRACASTIVCLAANPPDCFEAPPPVSLTPLVVDRCGDARCLRPRREYALPGLTHAQTVRRAQALAEREQLGAVAPQSSTVCSDGQAGGGFDWGPQSHSGNGEAAAIILLPFFALIGTISVVCSIEKRVNSDRWQRAQQLDAEIAELERLRTTAR